MIDPIIKSQLEKCKVANIPKFDDNTTRICIPKGAAVRISPYQVGKCYLVELSDNMLFPSNTSTVTSNWNGGIVPKHRYYKCEISKILGTMVKITGCGYLLDKNIDTFDLWEGWVPQDDLKLLQEI